MFINTNWQVFEWRRKPYKYYNRAFWEIVRAAFTAIVLVLLLFEH